MQGSCRSGQPRFSHRSKFINYDFRGQTRSPLKIFCDEVDLLTFFVMKKGIVDQRFVTCFIDTRTASSYREEILVEIIFHQESSTLMEKHRLVDHHLDQGLSRNGKQPVSTSSMRAPRPTRRESILLHHL